MFIALKHVSFYLKEFTLKIQNTKFNIFAEISISTIPLVFLLYPCMLELRM